ncbi:MAG: nodulation protein NfeD [Woeseiaceae bacterium]
MKFFSRIRAALSLAFLVLITPLAAQAESRVIVLEIEGGIGVAQSEYLTSGIEHAHDVGADLVLLKIDTPGGLVVSTQDMIQEILGSPVPVVTYVWPAGGHAASAGTYILMASHVAAMAPTTRIGAATPVSLGGDDATPDPAEGDDDTQAEDGETADGDERDQPLRGTAMERKVVNDAVAQIRGLAERYDRNADWAERAVREAITATATEALELNVIEYVATDEEDLFEQMNGHEVLVQNAAVILDTETVTVEAFEPDWRNKFLAVISNPEIVLLLAMVGVYGLMYEASNPGAMVPGVVGVICLLIAAYALQILPVNYAGLALIILGLALMTAEGFAPSFGVLGLGGIAAFVFGAIMLFDSGVPGFGVSIYFVVSVAILFALLTIWLVSHILKLRRAGPVSGRESIIGGTGTALENFDGDGKVWLEGESWLARSSEPITKDQAVLVTAMDGLVLEVEPARRQP